MITAIRHWARGITPEENELIKNWLGQFVDNAVPDFGSIVFKFHRGNVSAVEVRQSVQVKIKKADNTSEKKQIT